jgi:hypothetical protein
MLVLPHGKNMKKDNHERKRMLGRKKAINGGKSSNGRESGPKRETNRHGERHAQPKN